MGFEGFDTTVRIQIERSAALLAKAGLSVDPPADQGNYSVLAGAHAGLHSELLECPFVLRADLPLDRTARFLANAEGLLGDARLLLDFGCGRVMAGKPSLADDAWAALCRLAHQAGGHVLLERASPDFKTRHDVFGTPRPDWALTHRLKAALDPHRIFAPGRLPGKM